MNLALQSEGNQMLTCRARASIISQSALRPHFQNNNGDPQRARGPREESSQVYFACIFFKKVL